MSKTIFITGANGFLGSRIAIIAKKKKYNVIASKKNLKFRKFKKTRY